MCNKTNEYCTFFFFFQAEDGIRDFHVTGVQTCALPIFPRGRPEGGRQRPRRDLVAVLRGGPRRTAGARRESRRGHEGEPPPGRRLVLVERGAGRGRRGTRGGRALLDRPDEPRRGAEPRDR